MRPWASWTAKAALLAPGFAAAGGGLSGPALAGTGPSLLADPAGLPADVPSPAGLANMPALNGVTGAAYPCRGPR
jgi:hypothetical protein